jgi:hypothetical protein
MQDHSNLMDDTTTHGRRPLPFTPRPPALVTAGDPDGEDDDEEFMVALRAANAHYIAVATALTARYAVAIRVSEPAHLLADWRAAWSAPYPAGPRAGIAVPRRPAYACLTPAGPTQPLGALLAIGWTWDLPDRAPLQVRVAKGGLSDGAVAVYQLTHAINFLATRLWLRHYGGDTNCQLAVIHHGGLHVVEQYASADLRPARKAAPSC